MTPGPENRFWLVYWPDQDMVGECHPSYESALKEARRITRKAKGGKLIIMEAVTVVYGPAERFYRAPSAPNDPLQDDLKV